MNKQTYYKARVGDWYDPNCFTVEQDSNYPTGYNIYDLEGSLFDWVLSVELSLAYTTLSTLEIAVLRAQGHLEDEDGSNG